MKLIVWTYFEQSGRFKCLLTHCTLMFLFGIVLEAFMLSKGRSGGRDKTTNLTAMFGVRRRMHIQDMPQHMRTGGIPFAAVFTLGRHFGGVDFFLVLLESV